MRHFPAVQVTPNGRSLGTVEYLRLVLLLTAIGSVSLIRIQVVCSGTYNSNKNNNTCLPACPGCGAYNPESESSFSLVSYESSIFMLNLSGRKTLPFIDETIKG